MGLAIPKRHAKHVRCILEVREQLRVGRLSVLDPPRADPRMNRNGPRGRSATIVESFAFAGDSTGTGSMLDDSTARRAPEPGSI
jgi:hypothetical protein